jgi:hypothetical protein
MPWSNTNSIGWRESRQLNTTAKGYWPDAACFVIGEAEAAAGELVILQQDALSEQWQPDVTSDRAITHAAKNPE